MKKKLIEVCNLDDYICQTTGKIYIDGTLLLTPGAKDELSKKGIGIVYGPKPETEVHASEPHQEDPHADAHADEHNTHGHGHDDHKGKAVEDLEGLLLAVAAMLKNQYGVTDPEELKKLSCQVVKSIHEHI